MHYGCILLGAADLRLLHNRVSVQGGGEHRILTQADRWEDERGTLDTQSPANYLRIRFNSAISS